MHAGTCIRTLCTCTCTYTYTCIHTHIYIHTYTHECMHAHMCVYIGPSVCLSVRAIFSTCLHKNLDTSACIRGDYGGCRSAWWVCTCLNHVLGLHPWTCMYAPKHQHGRCNGSEFMLLFHTDKKLVTASCSPSARRYVAPRKPRSAMKSPRGIKVAFA
jgi:hypothetical protein